MPLSAGTRLGPYEILSALGAGGMGEVYRARDTRLDRTVAIKVLPESFAADPLFRERFDREARAISQLTHPHICTLYDVGEQQGTAYLVMEYLEGETLADRLKTGALPLDDALKNAIQIADALDKAHRAGLVHRDLKPGNVMLTKAGAKLLDFGLAKATAPAVAGAGLSMVPTTPPHLTAQGTILGTFQYMAPEQLEGQDADARTDIFAFGVVLYEMLTGTRAFAGKTHASLIGAILKDEPPPISHAQPIAPPALDRVVKKCLAKDPDRRWQSASDLHDELTWMADASAQAGAVVTRGRPVPGNARLAWSLLIVAVLALALAISTTQYFRQRSVEQVVTRFEIATPPTSDSYSFALSPDGRQVAFVANGEKASQLWVRPLDKMASQPLPGTGGASNPFWSPDGRTIGFFTGAGLLRIDLAGGAPQVLSHGGGFWRGGTWNRDGVIVLGGFSGPLTRMSATGGTQAPLTQLASGEIGHVWPQFLPDGHRVLFFAIGQQSGVYTASLDGGAPTRVVAAEAAALYASPGFLLRVAQGVLVAQRFDAARGAVLGEPIPVAQGVGNDRGRSAFSVSADVLAHRSGIAGRRQLIWLDRTGKLLGPAAPADENAMTSPSLSPDGRRVALGRNVEGNNTDVWLIDVGRNGVATRFTFDPSTDVSPLWSPDGTQVAFRSMRKGRSDLFIKPANGAGDERPLLATPQNKTPLDWSRDGRFLLYSNFDAKTQSDLWVLPLTGDRKPYSVVQSAFDETQGQFSPDGRWIAYTSNESGREQIYVRPFAEGGGQWEVSTEGGSQARWRPDGKELFYVSPDNRLMAVSIHVTADGHGLDADKPTGLFPTRLPTSGPGLTLTGWQSRPLYAVAPDGRFLMNVIADDGVPSPINVILNWEMLVKR